MRTTLNIDDRLLTEAQRITGLAEKSVLVREGLKALIERESALHLAPLGGGANPNCRPFPKRWFISMYNNIFVIIFNNIIITFNVSTIIKANYMNLQT
jgi:hypothetical protein